jgi:hypothetical protein
MWKAYFAKPIIHTGHFDEKRLLNRHKLFIIYRPLLTAHLVVGGIDVCAVLDEDFGDVDVAMPRRTVQTRLPPRSRLVQVCTLLQHVRDHLQPATHNSLGARGPVVRALDLRARSLGFDSPTGHE